MPRVSIGVDPSARSTGVVVLREDGLVLHAEALEIETTGVARLVEIRNRLAAICKRYGPFDVGVRESYSLGSTNRPFLLGEVGGIVQLALHDYAGRVEECAPKALKKFATGNASASKAEVMRAVSARWDAHYANDDIADAYVLARIGLSLLAPKGIVRRDQLEVVKKITAPKKRKNSSFRSRADVI